jgi:hypothetical protein
VNTKAGKVQATYHQKSSAGSGMEIHWEETAQPETKAKPHLDRKMPESRYSSFSADFHINVSSDFMFLYWASYNVLVPRYQRHNDDRALQGTALGP